MRKEVQQKSRIPSIARRSAGNHADSQSISNQTTRSQELARRRRKLSQSLELFKTPHPLVDPEGYVKEQERLRAACARAYRNFFVENCPENGVPARFTVHVVDVPDGAASYEFYGTALYQQALQRKSRHENTVL